MLQNITLLNSVQNNAGLALDVAQVAEHRANLCVSAMQVEAVPVTTRQVEAVQPVSLREADPGKRPCDEARASDRVRARLRGGSDDARFGRDIASAPFAVSADVACAAAGSERASGTGAAATAGLYSPRKKPQQASMAAKQLRSKLPAAIWASLVLSRV